MPIKFTGPVKPKKLKSPDPINMPIVRNDKVPKIKSEVLYYKDNGEMPPTGERVPESRLSRIDWKVAGDKLSVLDYQTGIEYLRLSESVGRSIDNVSANFGPGGDFEGWRLATEAEINSFMDYVVASGGSGPGFTTDGQSANVSTSLQEWQDFVRIMGYTYTVSDRLHSFAIFYDGSEILNSGVLGYLSGDARFRRSHNDGGIDNNTSSSLVSAGVWIVNDGGVSIESIEYPELNKNNPNSPYNQGG
tara:strand:- start:107695 stop:108435 length:741 start_codon:yes stop_codon:yes gene_type:complete